MSYRIVSSDNHIIEPPNLWTTRIDAEFKDRCPRLISTDGGLKWHCENVTEQGPEQGSNVGKRFENPDDITTSEVYEHVRAGGYDPDAAVKDLDVDGVDSCLMFPTIGFMNFRIADCDLRSAVFRAYNDYLADFCNAHPKRLGGIAMINIEDLDEALREVERSQKRGLAGVMITCYPPKFRTYDSPDYDRLWAMAQDMRIPVNLHAATNAYASTEINGVDKATVVTMNSRVANMDHYARVSLGEMIYSGVFERYPKLQVGAVEFELAWIPHFLDRIDFNYTQRGVERSVRFKNEMMPSDFWYRNCFAGFQEDWMGIRDRELIGVDNIQWGSDYPHTESTFPRSGEIIEEILAGCTEEEKAKIAGANTARVYGI